MNSIQNKQRSIVNECQASYGKKWMVNKTISKRIYVKREEIEYYKKLGYEVGYNL